MKRILFPAVLILQIVILGILGLQYNLIDSYGQSFQVLTVHHQDYHPRGDNQAYQNYDINYIPSSKWDGSGDLSYRTPIYVLLEPGEDGVYQVVAASEEKMKVNKQQVLLRGNYSHYSKEKKEYTVYYGFEYIDNPKQYHIEHMNSKWKVSIQLAPWGQHKIIAIESVK